ncbi:MAG TPA: DUF4097 family beta strand repeat-containing protein [Bryobacteraceae bacterium]|nr:DUF4097 family beta strand repeat-containing protein [Bryobacteraceae bacterium]
MRRGSIVGPLILIVIGLIFLLRNFLPEFRMMDLLSLYWPWLLIAWGGLRVVEVLNWHQKGQLVPRGGMNGGEWALVIFICLFGSGMYAARNANLFRAGGLNLPNWEILGERFDFSVTGTQPGVGKTPRVLIDNPRGSARVIGVDAEEIRVTGTKTIRALTLDDAQKENKSTNFEIVRSGDQIIVRTNLERASNARQVQAELEILVPKGSSIESRGRFGDVDVENIDGTVEISSDNAGVRMSNIGGDARVDLRKSDLVRILNARGNVDIKGRGQDIELENIAGVAAVNGQYSGEMKFRNLTKPFRFESQNTSLRIDRIEGEVELMQGRLHGRKLIGPIQINSKSKDIELSDFTGSVEIDVDRGDVQLRPARTALGKITARTRSGNAELVLPAGAKLDLKAEVKRGHIENDYGAPFRVNEDGRSATVSGSTGGPEVRVDVDRGEIRLRKWTNEDTATPPAAPTAPARPPAAPKAPLEITKQ